MVAAVSLPFGWSVGCQLLYPRRYYPALLIPCQLGVANPISEVCEGAAAGGELVERQVVRGSARGRICEVIPPPPCAAHYWGPREWEVCPAKGPPPAGPWEAAAAARAGPLLGAWLWPLPGRHRLDDGQFCIN